jgi:hypothetical protein
MKRIPCRTGRKRPAIPSTIKKMPRDFFRRGDFIFGTFIRV